MLLRVVFATVVALLVLGVNAQDDLDSLFESVFNQPDASQSPNAPPPPAPAAGSAAPVSSAQPPVTQAPAPQPPVPTLPPTCTGSCVPYYLCSGNEIITDGTGIIDIRVGEDPTVENECPNYLESCCEKVDVLEVPPTTVVNHEPVEQLKCGHRNADGLGFRITGNQAGESEYGEFPWMLAVLREDKVMDSVLNVYECGGSLIAPNVVLTAAHCVATKDKNTLVVRAGEWDTQTKNELHAHQDRRVREIVIHEKYNKGSLSNDIALLILDQPFDLAPNVQTVCLPPKNAKFDGSECFASGWGKNIFGKEGKYQVILKKVQLPIVAHDKCQTSLRTTRLGKRFVLDKSFVCAGGVPGKDTCRGDGGSPLVCPIAGTPSNFYQAGIVAWGIGCGEAGVPGVYVNVPLFRDWIDQQLTQRHVEAKHYTYN